MSEIEKLLQFQSEQKKKLGNLWLNSPALLKSEIGGAIYPQLIYRWFIRIQKKNDLPRIPLKGLRHTHASMLVDCQLDLEGVSKRMGHSQKTTTLNIYSHLYEDRDKHIANTLDELYFKEET